LNDIASSASPGHNLPPRQQLPGYSSTDPLVASNEALPQAMSLRKLLNPLLEPFGYQIFHGNPGSMGLDPFRDMHRLVASPRPVIFDVGANSGQTIRSLRQRFPAGEIHAFEPAEPAFAELQTNCGHLPDVLLNQLALGGETGEYEFYEMDSSPMSSFLPLGRDGWSRVVRTVRTQVTTVDEYCSRHAIESIDVLKSDTQGYDLEVLRGARRMLESGRIHLVYMEVNFAEIYESLPRLDEIFGFLADRGYALVAFYRFQFQHDRASWTDAMFVHPEYVGGTSHSSQRFAAPTSAAA
jgi:FkbM family methyltransferase